MHTSRFTGGCFSVYDVTTLPDSPRARMRFATVDILCSSDGGSRRKGTQKLTGVEHLRRRH